MPLFKIQMNILRINSQLIGKVITIVTISIAIIFVIITFVLGEISKLNSSGMRVYSLFMVNACVSLYYGSKWAKWIIGIFLLIIGGFQVRYLLPPYDNISNLMVFIIVLLFAISSILFSMILLFSKNVSNFIYQQDINRTKNIKNYLKYSWVIFLILSIILFSYDAYILLE
jgi:hypothetical protein